MKRLLGLLIAAAAAPLPAEQPAGTGPWIELLSPRTKSLDEHWTTTGNWVLEEGVATLTPRPGDKGWARWTDYLWSKRDYTDFEIEFEYKIGKGGNSGFFFRVADKKSPVKEGIEVQIFATDPAKPQDKLTDHDAGGIIPGLKPHKNNSEAPGEWNKMSVWHRDTRIVVHLNGTYVNAHDLGGGGQLALRPRTGPIGFQDHALPISLRKIRIRTLPPLAPDDR
ncbi:MAG: DUF1080 domain-containing protein [Akkermansiaceae bacterium]|nr:DUF1080 domain-containing protein [Akkermansiaceae bacterium]